MATDLASAFNISSNFYRAEPVEYVAGRSVQIHVPFNTEEIQRVTKHFTADMAGRQINQIQTDLIEKEAPKPHASLAKPI